MTFLIFEVSPTKTTPSKWKTTLISSWAVDLRGGSCVMCARVNEGKGIETRTRDDNKTTRFSIIYDPSENNSTPGPDTYFLPLVFQNLTRNIPAAIFFPLNLNLCVHSIHVFFELMNPFKNTTFPNNDHFLKFVYRQMFINHPAHAKQFILPTITFHVIY